MQKRQENLSTAGKKARRTYQRCAQAFRNVTRKGAAKLGHDKIMGLNRLAAGAFMMVALRTSNDSDLVANWSGALLMWIACAAILFSCAGRTERFAGVRRSIGLVVDISGTTMMLLAGGSETAYLYIVYLWIITGYGFRFGVRYMVAASALSIADFTIVIANDTFWGSYLNLSLGMLVGLAVLPAYSATLISRLAKARRRAEAADRAKTLFLASVSHELRTPLHAIVGSAEALRTTPLNGDQFSMVETINAAVEDQIALVGDLLEFTTTGAGRRSKAIDDFDLIDLIGKILAIVAVGGRKKGLLIASHVSARTPHHLRGDGRRLREVLLNLCSNAIKFTDHGSVTVSVDGFLNESGGVALRIEVSDTGIGIAPGHLFSIFDLFVQADEKIFDRFGGTGLGLALCRQQINLMGGSIGADSVPGSGSTFWVSLVVQAANAADAAPAPALGQVLVVAEGLAEAAAIRERLEALSGLEASGLALAVTTEQGLTTDQAHDPLIQVVSGPIDGLPGREIKERYLTSVSMQSTDAELRRALRIASLQSNRFRVASTRQAKKGSVEMIDRVNGCRILLADDNEVNRVVMARLLSHAGAAVTMAVDGEEALKLLSECEFDLGLLDVNMPGLNGIEAAQLYQFSATDNQRIPLVALTADGSTDTQAQCLRAGMAACLIKPIRSAALLAAINGILGDRTAPASVPTTVLPVAAAQRLDKQMLSDLQSLGGSEFVLQLVSDFKRDCLASLSSLSIALAFHDVQRFRFEAHSICSTSGNLGARALQRMCGPLSRIAEDALRSEGGALLAQLRSEWDMTSSDLDQHLAAGTGPRMAGDGDQRLAG